MDIYAEDYTTVPIEFTTCNASGSAVAPSSAFVVGDFEITRDDGTIKSSTNGMTIASPHNSVVGSHRLVIDTSNNTGDAGFWVAGSGYTVKLNPIGGKTVDGQTVVAKVGRFWLGPLTDQAGVTTLLSRIPSGLFTGITALAQWLGAIIGKQTPNSAALTEIRATGAGSGTYDATTDSQEALRDRGDAAWATASGFATAANLTITDGKVDAIKLQTDTIDDIKSKTDQLSFEDGAVDANVKMVNDVLVDGDGSDSNPWKAS